MRSIWKFPLLVDDGVQRIAMPVGAIIREVAGQHNQPTMWAEVSTTSPVSDRWFVVHGTGHVVAPNAVYIGVAHCPPFVWHIFEVTQ